MNQIAQKWGNSLAVRIPKAFAEQAKIREGTPLEISVEDGRVILQPQRRKYTLEEMLAGITDENMHAPVDWGAPVGREIWIYEETELEGKNGNTTPKMGQ